MPSALTVPLSGGLFKAPPQGCVARTTPPRCAPPPFLGDCCSITQSNAFFLFAGSAETVFSGMQGLPMHPETCLNDVCKPLRILPICPRVNRLTFLTAGCGRCQRTRALCCSLEASQQSRRPFAIPNSRKSIAWIPLHHFLKSCVTASWPRSASTFRSPWNASPCATGRARGCQRCPPASYSFASSGIGAFVRRYL